MGLYIQSLEHLPPEANRDYYIYLLDYGWEEPLGEALMKNYSKMAEIASGNKAVVMRGIQRVHFENQVLSWHHVNGENAEEILPAILITNHHPREFRENFGPERSEPVDENMKMILIPLKKHCNTTLEVVALIERVFTDIQNKKDLNEFRIERELKHGFGRALVDAVILEPNIGGFGFSFSKMIKYFTKK